MNLSKNKSILLLHIIIFIWGFTGILGKIIDLSSNAIVWNRMIIAFVCMGALNFTQKAQSKTTPYLLAYYFLIGIIIAIHWILFFEAIKLSTVSLALICLSSVSFFTAILEPIIQKRNIRIYEVILSLLVSLGIMIIFNYESYYYTAIIMSILSAFFAALFTVLNHQLIQKGHKSITITTWEMLGGALAITIYLLYSNQMNIAIIPQGIDILYILILGLICTAFAFYASIEVMKKISPFTVNLSVNLEPIYAIILAIIFFGEEEKMTNGFYLGASIIIVSIILNTFIKRKELL